MSSREIAELTGKQHKHVIQDIKSMIIQLNGLEWLEKNMPEKYRNRNSEYIRQNADLILNAIYKDGHNCDHNEIKWERDKRGYISNIHLNKKYIECLLTGYSIPLRMKVIDRMHELEDRVSQCQPKLPTTKELALMVIQVEEEKEKLQLEVNELKPKAEFHDIAIETHGAVSTGQAAKTLGTGRNRLLQWMRQNKWINRRNEPYQDKIEQGLLDVKLSNWEHPEKGLQEVITTLVTGKGLAKLAQLLNAKLAA